MTFDPNPDLRRALESQGLAVGLRYRCWNCNCLFSERHVIEIGGRFWCRAHCAFCVCGEPATVEDCDGNISCGLCEGSQPDSEGGDANCSTVSSVRASKAPVARVSGEPQSPRVSLESLMDIADYGFLGMLRISIYPPSSCSPDAHTSGSGAGVPPTSSASHSFCQRVLRFCDRINPWAAVRIGVMLCSAHFVCYLAYLFISTWGTK